MGRPITTQLDAYGRTIRESRTLGAATISVSYQYDLLGRRIGITDNAGNQWTYTYDSLNRKTATSDPDLGSWAYQYDNANRLMQSTDAKGQITRFTYDRLGRMLTKTVLYGTPQAATTTDTYDEARAGFYNVGQLTTAANAAATIRYNYDQAGRLTKQDYVLSSTTYTITQGFDAGDRLLWRLYPDGDSAGSAASPLLYDAAGRLKSVPGLVTTTVYNARGQTTSLTRANGVVTTYTYQDSRGWLTDIDALAGSTVLQDINYARNATGRIGTTTSSVTGESWTYGYDNLDRLLTATNTNTPTLTQTFTYDTVGNLTSNSLIGTYTYPATGSPRPHAVTSTPLGAYGYDANGSMTTAPGDTLTYDGENRLISVNSVQFVYGPDGARLKKINGATTTIYLGADIEIAGSTTTKYLPGDARRAGLGTTDWVHRDNLSSFRVETGNTGAIAWRANYRPYGERLVSVSGVAESKSYIGERLDDETGLLYLNARYYDPVLARFVQADPSDPSQPSVGPNRYAYALGNPIGAIDPSGLMSGTPAPPAFQINIILPSYWQYTHMALPEVPVGSSGFGFGYLDGVQANSGSWSLSALGQGLVSSFSDFLGSPSHYFGVTIPVQIGNGLSGCGALCDPAFQMSIGDVPGAALFQGLRAFAALGRAGEGTLLDASLIRYSQRSVGSDWAEIASSMESVGWQGKAIDVVRMPDELLTSLDNTRLLAAQETGTNVLANIRNFSDPIGDVVGRFSNRFGVPATWGDAVTFRIQNQGALFSETYPMGSPFTGAP
ncbi:RHS repeat-associated core domain-containing protein [Hypericibacter sp.]|uniref:RHS repeat-associated core domain-containing protein n=1 Tax=Hypericibacter sp. TaxID=2705401 RepID=UPI003D6CD0AE